MKLIILDRDGVINKESEAYIKSAEEWFPIAGSLEAIAALTAAGYTICVATNQSGVNRGMFTMETLEQIHSTMLNAVAAHGGKIHKIYFCPHAPTDQCNCRKPKTGMFEQLASDFNMSLSEFATKQVIFIGDSLRDVELGLATGCRMFLVTSTDSHGAESLQKISKTQRQKVTVVENLAEAARRILSCVA